MKKQLLVSAALVAGLLCFGCSNDATSDVTQIQLSDAESTVNGELLSQDETRAVYTTNKTETHADVSADLQGISNTIIHITQAGTYQISGELEDGQLLIDAPEQDVTLILDNATIACQTAPAILIKNANDPQQAGEAGVTITLAESSVNQIYGSHLPKGADETDSDIKYDGAISSNVSLRINGEGALQVNGDKEGIESKLHLTIDGGTIQAVSQDDALNACEDGVSVITINDGIVNCAVQNGEEGDGIDSNGSIYINGGFIVAQAHGTSQDSGLDSDLGIFINGGTVCATGNMYEEISEESAQQFVQFYFATPQQGNAPLVITDSDGNYVLAYTPVNQFSILEFSSPDLKDGETYSLYSGGTLTGTVVNGIYTQVDSYTNGTQMAHRGTMANQGRPNHADGQPPEDRNDDDGQRPVDDGQRPEQPSDKQDTDTPPEPPADGEKPTDAPEPPADGARPDKKPQRPGSSFDESAEQSIAFTISSDSHVFQGVAPYTEG